MRELSRRQRRAAVVLAVVAVLFCALDVAGAPFAGTRNGAQGYLGALYRGTDSVLGPTRRWLAAVPNAGHDATTTAQLRHRIDELQRAAADDGQAKAAGETVQQLQLQADRGGYRVLPARVLAIGAADGFNWTIVVDVGVADGVKLDQTVLAGADLVGRVIRVDASSTTVLLCADPGSGVGVRDQKSAEIGVVTGHGTARSTYSPLDPADAPHKGDVLVTGPRNGSTFVAGLTVGQVTGVTRQANGASIATVAHMGPEGAVRTVTAMDRAAANRAATPCANTDREAANRADSEVPAGPQSLLMPIHWGLFDLAIHPWRQPIEYLFAQPGLKLWSPEPGLPTEVLPGVEVRSGWWRDQP